MLTIKITPAITNLKYSKYNNDKDYQMNMATKGSEIKK